MDKKLDDGEHREYYEDRSLKAVYTIQDGKKEGTYTLYEKNSDRIILTEEYEGGKLHGKSSKYRYGRLEVTETYDHGTLTEKRWDDNHYETYKDGQLDHVICKTWRTDIDMQYKNGKEYNGTHYSETREGGRDGSDYKVEYTLVKGKYHGKYINDYDRVVANYDMGVLDGDYKASPYDGNVKVGVYKQGKFTGTVTSKDRKTVEKWGDGNLDCVTTYAYATRDRDGKTTRGDIVSEIRPNGTCVEYERGVLVKRYEQKNGKKEGTYEEFDPKGWRRTEAQYIGGKLNGFYKEFNSDGTVAERRFYRDGKDITALRNILMQEAAKNVSSTEGVAPKRSKLDKAIIGIKARIKSKKSKE